MVQSSDVPVKSSCPSIRARDKSSPRAVLAASSSAALHPTSSITAYSIVT